jgi:DNA-binding NarL/FixJ family response regulator
MKRIRILLADDHTMICDGFRKLLEPQYEVVGAVRDGHELMKAAVELKPDIALVDVGMPHLNGLDAARQLKRKAPQTKIIFLTMNTDPDVAAEALRIGASGYLLKNAPATELLQAIHSVMVGKSFVTGQINDALREIFIRDPRALERPKHLTPRERQVLQLLAEGRSGKEVADILDMSPRTVWYHKYRIMQELGVKSTAELVQYAIKHGIISAA